jgi:hypothetical protein
MFLMVSKVDPGSGVNKIVKATADTQLTDTFTKGLALDQFLSFRQKLMGWLAQRLKREEC